MLTVSSGLLMSSAIVSVRVVYLTHIHSHIHYYSYTFSWRSGKRARLTCVQLRVRASLRANVLSLENLNVIIRAIN